MSNTHHTLLSRCHDLAARSDLVTQFTNIFINIDISWPTSTLYRQNQNMCMHRSLVSLYLIFLRIGQTNQKEQKDFRLKGQTVVNVMLLWKKKPKKPHTRPLSLFLSIHCFISHKGKAWETHIHASHISATKHWIMESIVFSFSLFLHQCCQITSLMSIMIYDVRAY